MNEFKSPRDKIAPSEHPVHRRIIFLQHGSIGATGPPSNPFTFLTCAFFKCIWA